MLNKKTPLLLQIPRCIRHYRGSCRQGHETYIMGVMPSRCTYLHGGRRPWSPPSDSLHYGAATTILHLHRKFIMHLSNYRVEFEVGLLSENVEVAINAR
jgi:hypothetical protein